MGYLRFCTSRAGRALSRSPHSLLSRQQPGLTPPWCADPSLLTINRFRTHLQRSGRVDPILVRP